MNRRTLNTALLTGAVALAGCGSSDSGGTSGGSSGAKRSGTVDTAGCFEAVGVKKATTSSDLSFASTNLETDTAGTTDKGEGTYSFKPTSGQDFRVYVVTKSESDTPSL